MDNLPPELQSMLIQLECCIKNQYYQSSLLVLEDLTNLLSTDYQQFRKAYQILQQVSTPTQTRPTNLSTFSSSKPTQTAGINSKG